MKFKAIEITVKPYVVWLETKEPLGSLVVNEADVPQTQFGVCPMKIVDGELLDRTPEEMEDFETEFLVKTGINQEVIKIGLLKGLTFNYEGKSYPMNETARLYYHSIQHYTSGTHFSVRSLTGVESIAVADKDAFLEEYYKTIAGTLAPTI